MLAVEMLGRPPQILPIPSRTERRRNEARVRRNSPLTLVSRTALQLRLDTAAQKLHLEPIFPGFLVDKETGQTLYTALTTGRPPSGRVGSSKKHLTEHS